MKAWLIILTLANTNSWDREAYEFTNMVTCQESLKTMHVSLASGGDAESSVAAFCTETIDLFSDGYESWQKVVYKDKQ